MNKNNLLMLIGIAVIAVGSILFFSLQKEAELEEKGVISEANQNFAIEDTASIDKVVIDRKGAGTLTIVRDRSQKKWFIEGTDRMVQPYNSSLILETAKQIRVIQDVAEANVENVKTQLAIIGRIKVEYYKNGENKPFKTWFVGNATPDGEGTYMMVEEFDEATGKTIQSNRPYITSKPGFRGTLNTRYSIDPYIMEYPGVFNYKSKNKDGLVEYDISSIEVNFKNTPEQNYKLQLSPTGKLNLYNAVGDAIPKFDSAQAKHYVSHYGGIFYEGVVRDFTIEQMDSVRSIEPDYTITVKDKKNIAKQVKVWRKKLANPIENEFGLKQEYDVSRAIISLSWREELFHAQYQMWDVLFKPLSYFTTGSSPIQ